uniref:Coiled-coil domain-containing protein 113 n=1 Tax=Angiostrongylus cantonensis TaxID=6313 RepID=A0A0K0D2G3_ANGCA
MTYNSYVSALESSVDLVTSGYVSHVDTAEEDGTSNDADDLDDDDDSDQDVDIDPVFDEESKGVQLFSGLLCCFGLLFLPIRIPLPLDVCEFFVLGAALQNNLADVQIDISIVERLIAEVERSHRHKEEVILSYEKKLTELSAKIKKVEAERDKFVMEAESKKTDKKIREEYERKLADMRSEFRKLQMVQKEHARMQVCNIIASVVVYHLQARQERERQELVRYQSELKELKRVKVDLMKKIKEEMKRAQQEHRENVKRLAFMDKEARRRENTIRQLENKDRQREQFMKRTSEEIRRLRKAQKEQAKQVHPSATSRMAPHRVMPLRSARTPFIKGQAPPEVAFSPKQAKMKWSFIERKVLYCDSSLLITV